ncbi:MAG: EVE domain-containing protein [Candidatus Babeliaceae bacterium]|jgi:hypothetical protein
MTKYWVGVASREHVKKGIQSGIAQVCHGKQAPLKRMKSGDWIIYYSPTEIFGEKQPCRAFTAIGKIKDKEPYLFKMSDDFIPWRRDVDFVPARDVAIEPLIDTLSFIKNKSHWGFVFRYGLFEIPEHDFLLLAANMGVNIEK